jgi:cytoskeletal protein RodZ
MEKRRRGEKKKREPSLDQRSAKSQKEGEELLPIVWLLFCALLLLLFLPWQGAQKPGADQESQREKESTNQEGSQKARAREREERP